MPSSISPEMHRQLGVDLFNYVWTLLEKSERTRAEDDEMLHAAHASRFHWGEIGEPVNFARGEWQSSRVYVVLKRAEPARYHAQRSLDICLEHGIGDFDLAYAYEALARAEMIARDNEAMRRYLELARNAGSRIAEEDDKKIFDADVATIILSPRRMSQRPCTTRGVAFFGLSYCVSTCRYVVCSG